MDWKLADAKTKLSEVIRLALSQGPQRILRRNDAVMVLSEEAYEKLVGIQISFKDFLLNAPSMEELDLTRSPESMRDAPL